METSLLRSSEGQALVEYAMLIMLVAVVVIGILALFGQAIANMFNDIRLALPF